MVNNENDMDNVLFIVNIDRIKHYLLQNQVLVLQLNFLNY